MNTAQMKEEIFNFLNNADDEKIKSIYFLMKESTTYAQRKQLVKIERERYLNGISKTYSPIEVRQMALTSKNENG